MATTFTSFTPAAQRVGYLGLGADNLNNPIPRAELNFAVYAGVVTAAAAGEDQQLDVTCTLPPGYGYTLIHMSAWWFDAEAADTADWDADFRSFVSNVNAGSDPGSWLSGIAMPGSNIWHQSAVLTGRTFVAADLPQKIIIPLNGRSGLLTARNTNVTIDGGPLTFYFLAKFLEFDLNQAYHWAVNTPWPTR